MRFRALLAIVSLVSVLAACGCGGPIGYASDPVPVQGRSVYVDMPTIANPDQRIDAGKTCEEIRTRSIEWLRKYNYEIAADPATASLTLKAEVQDFHLGSTAARVWVGAGQSWHDTTIRIRPGGGPENTGRRRSEVAAGAYSNYKGDEAHRLAVVEEIAKMHVWVAQEYIGR